MRIEFIEVADNVQFITLQDLYKHLRLDAEDEEDIEGDINADLVSGLYFAAISEIESILGKSLTPKKYAQYDSGKTITLEEHNVIQDTIKVFEGEDEIEDFDILVNRNLTYIDFPQVKNDVKIEFVSGYTQDTVPAEYLMCIRLLVREYYDNPTGRDRKLGNTSAVERILHRTRRF